MTNRPGGVRENTGKADARKAREARLAAALKANLRRRKAASGPDPASPAGGATAKSAKARGGP